MTDQTAIIAAQQRRLIGVTVVVAGAVLWMWIAREYGAEALMFAITMGVGAIAIALYWALRNMTPVSLFLVASMVSGCICLPNALVELGNTSSRSLQCRSNLRQIQLALLVYESVHHSFPPAFTTDKQGRPLHSWRTLILPYLEEQETYRQIRLDEPWNSPHNLAITRHTPAVFQCPSWIRTNPHGPAKTPYVAVTGKSTMWPGAEAVEFPAVTDGASQTISLVEWPESNVHWSEPRDLPLAELYLISNPSLANRRHEHRHEHGEPYVALVDGRVLRLSLYRYNRSLVNGWFTRAGNELAPIPSE